MRQFGDSGGDDLARRGEVRRLWTVAPAVVIALVTSRDSVPGASTFTGVGGRRLRGRGCGVGGRRLPAGAGAHLKSPRAQRKLRGAQPFGLSKSLFNRCLSEMLEFDKERAAICSRL